jgi:hypothetical protein
MRVTASADLTSSSPVSCTLTIGPTTVTRVGTPLVSPGQVTVTFAAHSATTGGQITLTCTGQLSTQRLTIQYVQVTGTTP